MMHELFFKSLSYEDLPYLYKWMNEEHVAAWFGEGKAWSLKDIEEKYSAYVLGYKRVQGEAKDMSAFIVEFNKRPMGYIQMYNALDFTREDFDPKEWWKDSCYLIGAIDFYVGEPDFLGKGLGSEILKSFLSTIFFPKFSVCMVDPDKNNKNALRAYTRAGFIFFKETKNSIVMLASKENIKNEN